MSHGARRQRPPPPPPPPPQHRTPPPPPLPQTGYSNQATHHEWSKTKNHGASQKQKKSVPLPPPPPPSALMPPRPPPPPSPATSSSIANCQGDSAFDRRLAKYIALNQLDDGCAKILQKIPQEQAEAVMKKGFQITLHHGSGSTSAVVMSRVRAVQASAEVEQPAAEGLRRPPPPPPASRPCQSHEDRLAEFVAMNLLDTVTEKVLYSLSPENQRWVMNQGFRIEHDNPSAFVLLRCRRAESGVNVPPSPSSSKPKESRVDDGGRIMQDDQAWHDDEDVVADEEASDFTLMDADPLNFHTFKTSKDSVARLPPTPPGPPTPPRPPTPPTPPIPPERRTGLQALDEVPPPPPPPSHALEEFIRVNQLDSGAQKLLLSLPKEAQEALMAEGFQISIKRGTKSAVLVARIRKYLTKMQAQDGDAVHEEEQEQGRQYDIDHEMVDEDEATIEFGTSPHLAVYDQVQSWDEEDARSRSRSPPPRGNDMPRAVLPRAVKHTERRSRCRDGSERGQESSNMASPRRQPPAPPPRPPPPPPPPLNA